MLPHVVDSQSKSCENKTYTHTHIKGQEEEEEEKEEEENRRRVLSLRWDNGNEMK